MVNILKKENRVRIQILGAIAFNGNLKGFMTGKIYKGISKGVCVPVLNCYSCPGAVGACPIGSLQNVVGVGSKFGFYVIGLLVLFGILMGRFFCGFLCPIGFLQDLLFKIKSKKIKIKSKIHDKLKYLKYFNLFVLVMILPFIVSLSRGYSIPFFCKYICPAGIIEASVPLIIKNPMIRSALGILFTWKFILTLIFIVLSILIYRVFCKYICPLGALYGIFNPISVYKLEVDNKKCIKCNRCSKICKMNIEPFKEPNSPECIRCLDCKDICPTGAISNLFKLCEENEDGINKKTIKS